MSETVAANVVLAIRQAADRDPDHLAVRDGPTRWTHRDLHRRANAWATKILADPGNSQNVGLLFSPSAEMVAALLGTLTAGQSFFVLDPTWPTERLAAQLSFADVTLLLAQEDQSSALHQAGWLGTTLSSSSLQEENDPVPVDLSPDHAASLSLTSGSSGHPKAVIGTHRTLATAANYLQKMFIFSPRDIHAVLSPLSVASTPAQIFAPLAAGACLGIYAARQSSISQLSDWLIETRVTTLQTVPSLFRVLARHAEGQRLWPSLRALKLGGEMVTTQDANLFFPVAHPEAILINGLGLTEAGFNVCWATWAAGKIPKGPRLPVGRPPANLLLRIESQPGVLTNRDEPGEIVVQTPALPIGYWRDPDRTARTYFLDPTSGDHFLRTGDVGYWRDDGMLEHRGRLDDMVKIRGRRVDPTEWEVALMASNEVDAVAVLPGGDEENALLEVFVQFHLGTTWDSDLWRMNFAAKCPDPATPYRLHQLATLPRLSNGKVDRQALLASVQDLSENVVRPPGDALEITLHGLFSRVLPKISFGVSDSFFDLGGDSLSAAQLFTAISKVLQTDLPLTELVQHPTVERLATLIRERGWNLSDHPVTLLTQAPAKDAIPLFVWPGAGSDVMALSHLAHHMGPAVAFYAIQHRGADGRRVYDLKVSEMANRGVALIRRVQSHGPYALCGSSFGGLVALEVARRFLAEGETIRMLALLDTYAPGYLKKRPGLTLTQRFWLILRALRPVGHKDDPSWAMLKRGVDERVIRFLARKAVHHPNPQAKPLPLNSRFLHLQEACFTAGDKYHPTPYPGQVHLFRVQKGPPAQLFKLNESLGWHHWIDSSRLKIDVVPGCHGEHLREPHVQIMAKKLRNVLLDIKPSPSRHDGSFVFP